MLSLTIRFLPALSRLQSHCTLPQCVETELWLRRFPPAPAYSAAPAALELSLAECLQGCKQSMYRRSLHSRKLNLTETPSLPMRMADSRSLLASLTGFVSALLPSPCPARCGGAAGGGSGGGGGPGGGGIMHAPGGGTGGSG